MNVGDTVNDEFFMEEALKEAIKARDIGEIPIGAVIVKNNEIIGRGYNKVESTGNSLNHAELIAIEEASQKVYGWRMYGCTIYVTLEPCAMCSGALVYSRMGKVVFGAYDKKRGFCGSLENLVQMDELNHKVEVIEGVLEEKCRILIQDFFLDLRKRNSKMRNNNSL